MTYQEAREFIDQSNQYGSVLGLGAVTELLNRLGNPQDQMKVIHVAGTNGKGSTTAFITAILSSEGYRIGRYISPAVFSYLERIQISKKEEFELPHAGNDSKAFTIRTDYITEKGVCDAIAAIKPICEEMVRDHLAHPTSFEIETAMAMLYLKWEQVDFAVIEVGLGGRLDATNVIQQPICCVITPISMDHMQFLGDTLEQITVEKAGIIKKGATVVTNNKRPEVLQVLEQTSMDLGTSLRIVDPEDITMVQYSPERTTFHHMGQEYVIKLLGEYQISNAILAIHTARILNSLGCHLSDNAIKEGLLQATWSGRFEIIARKPYLIMDGAHNEDAAIHLKKSIQLYFLKRRIIFVIGVLADKDYKSILKITTPLAQVIITLTPNNSRALPSAQLAKEAKLYGTGKVIDAGTVQKAINCAYEEAGEEDIIIVFGSLSFLGEVCDNITSSLNSED